MIAERVVRVALLATLALPTVAGAQGGLLKKMKAKAAEAAAKKAGEAIDKATAPAPDTTHATAAVRDTAVRDTASPPKTAPRAVISRRSKPLDPTVLETSGQPAQTAATTAPAPVPVVPNDPLNAKEWHGTPQSREQFVATVPKLTDAAIDAYVRARTAQAVEARRLLAMWDPPHRYTPAWRDTVKALQSRPLADDEKIPGLQGYDKVTRTFNGKGDFERRLDAVADRELGGTLTRLQFYQVHEIVQMFLGNAIAKPGTHGPGRGLTGAELAALERHRADLVKLTELMKGL
jgi:hypothetical protein